MSRDHAGFGVGAPKISGGAHTERLHHAVLKKLLRSDSGDVLDATLQIVKAFAGVAELRARLESRRKRLVFLPTPILEPARMAQHMASGNAFGPFACWRPVLQIFLERAVEIELAILHEFKNRIRKDLFAHRGGREYGISCDWCFGLSVGEARVMLPGEFVSLNHTHAKPRQLRKLH